MKNKTFKEEQVSKANAVSATNLNFKALADSITSDEGFIAWQAVVTLLEKVAAQAREEVIKVGDDHTCTHETCKGVDCWRWIKKELS